MILCLMPLHNAGLRGCMWALTNLLLSLYRHGKLACYHACTNQTCITVTMTKWLKDMRVCWAAL